MFVFNVTLFQSATQRLTESTTRLMISFSVTVSAVLLYCLAKVSHIELANSASVTVGLHCDVHRR